MRRIKYLLKKHFKNFLQNGCELHSSDYLVVDKNKLNDDEVLIIQRIRVGYDKHATDSGLETQ